MPSPLFPPLGRLGIGRQFGASLHGRSRYHPEDIPGSNVINGYTDPGWGDAIDIYCAAGCMVYAMEDCRQVLHRKDDTFGEIIYLQGPRVLVVLGNVEAVHAGRGHHYAMGDVVGCVRTGLKEPHLHFEIARGQHPSEQPLCARTPREFAEQLRGVVSPPVARVVDADTNDVLGLIESHRDLSSAFPGYAPAAGGQSAEEGWVYVCRTLRAA